MQAVEVAKANFLFGVPTLEVHFPPCNPYLSTNRSVNISFDYYVSKNLTQVDHFTYSLDKKANSTLTSSLIDFTHRAATYSDYSVSKALDNLSDGNHSVIFYAQFLNNTVSDFWHLTIIVDAAYSHPVPIMSSPLNQTTYNNRDVPMTFTVNTKEGLSWVGQSLYSLDSSDWRGTDWEGRWRNGTLRNLTDGPHTLNLVITIGTQTDERYVQVRETVYFNVDTNKTTDVASPSPSLSPSISSTLTESPAPTPTETIPSAPPLESPTQTSTLEPSPTLNNTYEIFGPLAIAVGLMIAVVAVGLLVILAKHRGRNSEKASLSLNHLAEEKQRFFASFLFLNFLQNT